jgi:Cu(I)/Ag(I) efflux system membrane fusion protein
MKNFLLGFLMAAFLAGVGYWVVSKPTAEKAPTIQKASPKYHCPMHPSFVSDKPGVCPICAMNLVPIEAGAPRKGVPETGEAQKKRKILYYVDPMNPQNRSDKPGKAPDGMDLVPIYLEEAAAEATAVSGYVPVKISAERRQMMGVMLEEARVMNLEQSIRTVGRVTYDETRLHHVHTKFEGFIEHLFADFVGQFVKKGDPLFSIYSPELLATQKELLLALRAQEQLTPAGSAASFTGIDLVEAARQRLSLWDIGSDEIARVEQTREPIRAVIIRSPYSGFVSAKTATHGMKVMPIDSLYDIIDLSSIWVLADVYEVDLPFVKVGQPAEMTLAYQPAKSWKGHVTYIYPTLDDKTRTAKIRLEFANASGLLKPEMYADVVLKGHLGRAIGVPESAVISTGERMIVFVEREAGLFEPREVTTGLKVRNYYEIKNGVRAGEKVVTGANFLLDSESKLKASLSGLGNEHQHGQ